MARFYDDDEDRLPHGFNLVGYDADTGVYTCKDQEGYFYESLPHIKFGTYTKLDIPPDPSDDEQGYIPGTSVSDTEGQAWRMMAPFVLIIVVFLLSVYVIIGGNLWPFGKHKFTCAKGQNAYTIFKGDTCWAISKKYDMTMDELLNINHGLDCDALKVGHNICVKDKASRD